ncbi:MAG: phage integrase N-terminal SAM-like domain-containing protein [Paracoccaceae bacterium]|nr:phage integrase N-terminal SAM-like domain-containing protein [Paracoccaceae bacterium]
MTQSDTRTVTPFRQRMIDQMRMASLTENTQYATILEIRRLARHTRQSQDRLDAEQVRAWLKGRIDCGLKSRSTNVALAALKFLYRYVLRRPELVEGLRNRRSSRTLPRPAHRKQTGAQLQSFRLPDWRQGDASTDSRRSIRTRGSSPRVDDRRKCRFGQPLRADVGGSIRFRLCWRRVRMLSPIGIAIFRRPRHGVR